MSERKPISTNSINDASLEERCVVNKMLKLVCQRWTAEILLLIAQGYTRFSQVKTHLAGISDAALSRSLGELLAAGILTKTVFGEVPVRVKYKLSGSGRELVQLLHQLCQWGKRSIEPAITPARPALPTTYLR